MLLKGFKQKHLKGYEITRAMIKIIIKISLNINHPLINFAIAEIISLKPYIKSKHTNKAKVNSKSFGS